MRVIGHRGCLDHYPENTVAAVQGCAPHVDMVEIDIQPCGTGEIVVFHDETLDELTEDTGTVGDRAFEELTSLRVAGSEETIPSFEAVIDALPPGLDINVELKQPGMYEDIAPLLHELDQEVIVSSFHTDATREFRDDPLQTAHLFFDDPARNLDVASTLGCESVHPYYEIIDESFVEAAHDRGFDVNAWTVPTEHDVIGLRNAGVDGVVVDSWTVIP